MSPTGKQLSFSMKLTSRECGQTTLILDEVDKQRVTEFLDKIGEPFEQSSSKERSLKKEMPLVEVDDYGSQHRHLEFVRSLVGLYNRISAEDMASKWQPFSAGDGRVMTSLLPANSVDALPQATMRGVLDVESDAEDIMMMHDLKSVVEWPACRMHWDPAFAAGDVIEVLNDRTVLARSRIKGVWPVVSPRDVAIVLASLGTRDGGLLSIAGSVVDSRVPNESGHVRAWCPISLFHFHRSHRLRITYLVSSDPGGRIPASVTDSLNRNVPLGLVNILDYCRSYGSPPQFLLFLPSKNNSTPALLLSQLVKSFGYEHDSTQLWCLLDMSSSSSLSIRVRVETHHWLIRDKHALDIRTESDTVPPLHLNCTITESPRHAILEVEVTNTTTDAITGSLTKITFTRIPRPNGVQDLVLIRGKEPSGIVLSPSSIDSTTTPDNNYQTPHQSLSPTHPKHELLIQLDQARQIVTRHLDALGLTSPPTITNQYYSHTTSNGIRVSKISIPGHPIGLVHGYKRINRIHQGQPSDPSLGKKWRVPLTVRDLAAVIENPGARKQWDEIFTGASILQTLPTGGGGDGIQDNVDNVVEEVVRVVHSTTKAVWPTSARDLIAVIANTYSYGDALSSRDARNGECREFNSVVFSVEESFIPTNLLPVPSKEYVRANLDIGAWRVTLLPPAKANGQEMIEIHYMVQSNPNGWIPESLLKTVAAQFPMCIGTVVEYLDKYGFPPYFEAVAGNVIRHEYEHAEGRWQCLVSLNHHQRDTLSQYGFEVRIDKTRWLGDLGRVECDLKFRASFFNADDITTMTAVDFGSVKQRFKAEYLVDSPYSVVLKVELFNADGGDTEAKAFSMDLRRVIVKSKDEMAVGLITLNGAPVKQRTTIDDAEHKRVDTGLQSISNAPTPDPLAMDELMSSEIAFRTLIDLQAHTEWRAISLKPPLSLIQRARLDTTTFFRISWMLAKYTPEELLAVLFMNMECRRVWDRRRFMKGEFRRVMNGVYVCECTWKEGWGYLTTRDVFALRIVHSTTPGGSRMPITKIYLAAQSEDGSFCGWVLEGVEDDLTALSNGGGILVQTRLTFYGTQDSQGYYWGRRLTKDLPNMFRSLVRYLQTHGPAPAIKYPFSAPLAKYGEVEVRSSYVRVNNTGFDVLNGEFSMAVSIVKSPAQYCQGYFMSPDPRSPLSPSSSTGSSVGLAHQSLHQQHQQNIVLVGKEDFTRDRVVFHLFDLEVNEKWLMHHVDVELDGSPLVSSIIECRLTHHRNRTYVGIYAHPIQSGQLSLESIGESMLGISYPVDVSISLRFHGIVPKNQKPTYHLNGRQTELRPLTELVPLDRVQPRPAASGDVSLPGHEGNGKRDRQGMRVSLMELDSRVLIALLIAGFISGYWFRDLLS